ncbi:MAG TPA: AI-2E family transporter [Pseudomonas xinjiangensis]|uniref:AI-2E family transporter n=2 Tax=root TaxID=1 RepID=A0A7V1BNJ8_9GAMM|nr:AI-2E family transporter [Halopseudomonas xinjiangensis]HEC48553.1 AI-2E family transporter [Halopseudomonas xinjiangensis]
MTPIVTDTAIVRLLLVLVLIAGVFFFVDFVVPVLAALIICFASWPVYQRLLAYCAGRDTVAASIALLVILLGLVIPIALVFSYAFHEVKGWVEWLLIANQEGISAPLWIEELPGFGQRLGNLWNEHLSEPHDLGYVVSLISGEHLGGISRWVLSISGSAVGLLLTVLFMLITLFFLYKDGASLVRQLDVVGERILPVRWNRFSRVVPATVSSTVIGMGLIAVGEGVILGVAYWIAGVPSPVALGVLTAFMALVPGGAPLTFSLVSLYLVGTGDVTAGIALFLWGSLELFVVDKTLRPRLVGGPIKLPFLPTFFGLIGGVKTMGLVGLFVGPVLMALLVAIWREWLHAEELKFQQTTALLPPASAGAVVSNPDPAD